MNAASQRFGWYLAVLQLFFTLCWTVYVIYLPKLAAAAGIAARRHDPAADARPGGVHGVRFRHRHRRRQGDAGAGAPGPWVAAVTALSCAAFLALPFVAGAGAPVFLALTVLWAVTSSALRAPPLMLLGKYAAKPSIPYLSSLAMLGYGIAGALGPYLTIALRDLDPRVPFAAVEPGAGAHHSRHDLGRAHAGGSAAAQAREPAGARLRHHDQAGHRVRARHDRAGARLSDAFRARQRAACSCASPRRPNCNG